MSYSIVVKIPGTEGYPEQSFKEMADAYAEYERVASGNTYVEYSWVCLRANGITQKHECVQRINSEAVGG